MPNLTWSEFLTLSSKEENIREAIIKSGFRNIETIKNIDDDLVSIIKLSLQDPEVDLLCKQADLMPHWATIWSECGSEGHLFQPQRIMDCFDLIKSIYLYWIYLQEKDSPCSFPFLEQAAKQGCFDAMKTLVFILLEDGKKENYSKAIMIANQAAEQHLTPGYILLAKVYLTINQQQKNAIYLYDALESVYLAEKCYGSSAAEINNAYPKGNLIQSLGFESLIKRYQRTLQGASFSKDTITDIFTEVRITTLENSPIEKSAQVFILSKANRAASLKFDILKEKHYLINQQELCVENVRMRRG